MFTIIHSVFYMFIALCENAQMREAQQRERERQTLPGDWVQNPKSRGGMGCKVLASLLCGSLIIFSLLPVFYRKYTTKLMTSLLILFDLISFMREHIGLLKRQMDIRLRSGWQIKLLAISEWTFVLSPVGISTQTPGLWDIVGHFLKDNCRTIT